ncbi:hypothetical protein ACHQM5_030666 [Ranunculus cassubicifolius]
MSDSMRLGLLSSQQNSSSGAWMMVPVTNLILIIVSFVILLCSQKEEPTEPIRAWVIVYIVLLLLQQCISCAGFCSSDGGCMASAVMCNSLLALVAFIWWIVGICWVVSGGHTLQAQAPHLYWLSVVLIGMPLIGLAVFTCLCCCCAAVVGVASNV